MHIQMSIEPAVWKNLILKIQLTEIVVKRLEFPTDNLIFISYCICIVYCRLRNINFNVPPVRKREQISLYLSSHNSFYKLYRNYIQYFQINL